MDITIRRAMSKDCEKVLELLKGIAKLHHNGRPDIFDEGVSKYGASDFERMLSNEEAPLFVSVDENDNVTGYAICQMITYKDHAVFKDFKSLYIDDFCVDETIRGNGIGKKLFAHIKEYAFEQGVKNITLNVWAFNESAIAFYEACGMKEQRRYMELCRGDDGAFR